MGHDPWNDRPDEGFMTTNAGDDARAVGNYDRMGRVSGHVVLNHAAVCLNRFGKPLTGTQVQRNFVQSVASSVPGQSSPLLYLEGGLFPRLFYASSSQDAIAPLGALPLFSYMDKKIRTAWHPSFNTFERVSRPFRLTQAGMSDT